MKFLFRITLTLTGQKQPVANKNRCPQNVKNFREKACVDALCLLDVDNDPTVWVVGLDGGEGEGKI